MEYIIIIIILVLIAGFAEGIDYERNRTKRDDARKNIDKSSNPSKHY